MALSDNWFKTIEEARDKLVELIAKGVAEHGRWSWSTCPTGAGYGWDPLMHEALVWLQNNPPAGIKITSRYQHECYDWLAVTDLDTVKPARSKSAGLVLSEIIITIKQAEVASVTDRDAEEVCRILDELDLAGIIRQRIYDRQPRFESSICVEAAHS